MWPGDRPFERREETDGGGVVSWLSTTCHVGTHLEGPRHLRSAAPGLDTVAVGRLVGPAEVVSPGAQGGLVTPAGFPEGWRPRAPRLLLRTDSHPLGAAIGPDFTALTPGAVTWLRDLGVDVLGVDVPSVDPFAATDLGAHRALAEAGMLWLEGLLLSHVDPGLYYLVALPLPLTGAEASPARAILGVWEPAPP